MKKVYFIILIFILPLSLIAQEKVSDMQLVINTIENYFTGYIERDVQKLNSAFDIKNGIMKIPFRSEQGNESFQNEYFEDIIPKWSSKEQLSPEIKENCTLKILNLEIIEGQMGVSKIEMKIGETVYIDLLSLQKLNGKWKITNKMFLVK